MARLFVLGAGFSRYTGLPLGYELFPEVLREARRVDLYNNILQPDVERFRRFKERTEGVHLDEEEIDAEQFIWFLDVEHFLGFEGSDKWSEEGSRSQQIVKNLIARILLSRQRQIKPAQWEPYFEFASRLQPYDLVITFNYDTLLELSLDHAKTPYRLVPSRYEEVRAAYSTVKLPETEVVVLKVHGSIDWFDIVPWEHNQEYFAAFPFEISDRHVIFGNREVYKPTPIVKEPHSQGSALHRIRRVRNLDSYFSSASLVIEAPLILTPSHQKLLFSDPLKEMWWGFNFAGSVMETVGIIGFSLPTHDQYAVQALYALVRNFQHYDTGELVRKTNLRIVDVCQSDAQREALKMRYRFVDWNRVDLVDAGFDSDAVKLLFHGTEGLA